MTHASLKSENLELLFSLPISYKIYGENKDSSGRPGVPCLHSKDDSYLTVRVSLSLQPYTSLAQKGKIKCTLQSGCLQKVGIFFVICKCGQFLKIRG